MIIYIFMLFIGWVHHIPVTYHIPNSFDQPISNQIWMFICFVVYLYNVNDLNFYIIKISLPQAYKKIGGMALKWRNIWHHKDKYHPKFKSFKIVKLIPFHTRQSKNMSISVTIYSEKFWIVIFEDFFENTLFHLYNFFSLAFIFNYASDGNSPCIGQLLKSREC